MSIKEFARRDREEVGVQRGHEDTWAGVSFRWSGYRSKYIACIYPPSMLASREITHPPKVTHLLSDGALMGASAVSKRKLSF